MVNGIFALPRTGKTLLLGYIASLAVAGKNVNVKGIPFTSHKKYKYVYTNFYVKGALQLDFDKLGITDFSDSLILIDEIQLFADSRNFKNFSDNLKFFFSMHGHFHTDIIYATQSYEQCDKRIRNVTDRLFYLDCLPLNLLRLREIVSYFDVDNRISEGYTFAGRFSTHFFYRPRLYKYADSWDNMGFTPAPRDARPWDALPWDKDKSFYLR